MKRSRNISNNNNEDEEPPVKKRKVTKQEKKITKFRQAQLSCGGKPRTGFGELKGKKVFIKGPFTRKNLHSAKTEWRLGTIKKHMKDLFSANPRIVKISKETYLVCDDLTRGYDGYPMITKYSRSNPEGVEVIDFDYPNSKCMHISVDRINALPENSKKKVSSKFCDVVIFRYAFEVSDTNPRNILLLKSDDDESDANYDVCSVDEANCFTEKQRKAKFSAKKQRYLFSKKLSRAWKSFLTEYLSNNQVRLKLAEKINSWIALFTKVVNGPWDEPDPNITCTLTEFKNLLEETQMLEHVPTVIENLQFLSNLDNWDTLM